MGESVQPPRQVGRYAIFDEIASGGMATVYIGRLAGSGGFARTVAIKSLHPMFAKDPEFVAMFLDEARLAARIRHPNVVPTLDVVASKGEVFLVMEYVQGESLSRLVRAMRARSERVPLPILLRLMADALRGLHAAHEARDERGLSLDIVHRDVTPQNILVGIDGVARLLDFGVAKAAGRAYTTREGQIKGKLAYMAPEQILGEGVSRATDLYAASVVLWEMLTGERLFAGGSEVDVVAKLLGRKIDRPRAIVPEIPQALDDLVMKGLAAKAEDRFASARDMCMALGECGVPEAPALAVGEWVEQVAATALADRSAKIAAIESGSDPLARARDSLGMSAAPASSPRSINEARTLPPTDPVAADGFSTGAVRPVVSDAATVTINGAILRRAPRFGAVGIGAGVVALLLAVGVVSSKMGHGAAPQSGVVASSGGAVATVTPSETHAAATPPEAPAPAVSAAPAAPADSSPPTPVRAVAPSPKRPSGTTPARAAAAGGPAKAKAAPTDVFSTRE